MRLGLDTYLSLEQMGLVVALGAGLLIGLDRERRKGSGPERHAAGLRTFMVAALAGALAQILSGVLAAITLAALAVLVAMSYWRSRAHDPGLTTEVALIATALIGMLAVSQPPLAAACAVVLAGVLAAKERLHHFATDWLTQRELHDGLLLAALALVLLPMLPAAPLAWLGQMSPRQILMLVIMILLMQAMGHVARRLLGNRAGLAMSGLLGGFVSSTATISAMGSLLREGRAPLRLCWCAAVLSMAATWVQLWLMALLIAPKVAAQIWMFSAWGLVAPLLLGAVAWRRAEGGHSGAEAHTHSGSEHGVLRLREALTVALLLIAGAVLVNLAQQHGTEGLLAGTALAAFADAHAPMASLFALAGAGKLAPPSLLLGLMAALCANAVTRSTVAYVSGGARFGHAVAGALLLNLGWAGAWVFVVSR